MESIFKIGAFVGGALTLLAVCVLALHFGLYAEFVMGSPPDRMEAKGGLIQNESEARYNATNNSVWLPTESVHVPRDEYVQWRCQQIAQRRVKQWGKTQYLLGMVGAGISDDNTITVYPFSDSFVAPSVRQLQSRAPDAVVSTVVYADGESTCNVSVSVTSGESGPA